jgi:prepilin-type N-terminal cleavage/methylation domain-containing protein
MFIVPAPICSPQSCRGGCPQPQSSRYAREDTRPYSKPRGFTLLEITLAVAILGMMSLAIYRFMQSSLTAIRVSSDATAADAVYSGLRDLLTAQWQTLPPGKGALMGEPFKFNDRPRDEIRWTCGGGPGLLTRYAPGDFIVTLRLQPHKKDSDSLDLGVLRKPKNDTAVTDSNETWMPLIENVHSLQVRYLNLQGNTYTWQDRWTDTQNLPRLVKLIAVRTDSPVPWEVIIPLRRTPL